MSVKRPAKNKRFFQGIGLGYVICLITHILAALLPMYIVFPFAQSLFGQGQNHTHGPMCRFGSACPDQASGLLNHILGDLLILTMIIVPVAVLTWLGHKLVHHFKCKCGVVHNREEDPCESCPHKKF